MEKRFSATVTVIGVDVLRDVSGNPLWRMQLETVAGREPYQRAEDVVRFSEEDAAHRATLSEALAVDLDGIKWHPKSIRRRWFRCDLEPVQLTAGGKERRILRVVRGSHRPVPATA